LEYVQDVKVGCSLAHLFFGLHPNEHFSQADFCFVLWQVELFCVGNLINCVLEADEEFLCMDFRFTLRDGGMRATFQLLHMVLEVMGPLWFIHPVLCEFWLSDWAVGMESIEMIFEASNINCL
jgi:hypothetical protein